MVVSAKEVEPSVSGGKASDMEDIFLPDMPTIHRQ